MNKKILVLDLLYGDGREDIYGNDWYTNKGLNLDYAVENDEIRFNRIGAKPTFHKNWDFQANGQLPIAWRSHTGDSFTLDNFHSDQFPLPEVDLIGMPFKEGKVLMNDIRLGLADISVRSGIWNMGPYQHTAKTPIIVATGSVGLDGFKLVTAEDISKARVMMNVAYPKLATMPMTVVINSESYQKIVDSNDTLKAQQSYQGGLGFIYSVPNMRIAGFDVVSDERLPYYTSGVAATATRKPYGSTILSTDRPAAVFFVDKMAYVTAMGSIQEFNNQGHAGWQGDVMSALFRCYNGPLSSDLQTGLMYCGAIVRPT